MTELTVVPLAPTFAAEVRGIDCTETLDERTQSELRTLLAQRGVLVFREQCLEPHDQVRVLGAFGNVLDEAHDGSMHSYVSTDATSLVKPGRLLFHTDNHFMPVPLEVLSLCGVQVDQKSASTLFVDNVAAYGRLSADLTEMLEGAEAVNVSYYFYGDGGDRPARWVAPDHPDAPRTAHPCIGHYPGSGAPYVYVTELHTHHIVNMERGQSDDLLRTVEAVLYEATWMYEHHWQPGDLLIWDNHTTQHARGPVPDLEIDPTAPARSLRRVVVGPIDYQDQMALAGAAAPVE